MSTSVKPPTKPRAWMMAARPQTLWASIAPVVVGSALASADDAFRWDALLALVVAAVAIQVAVNFANDVADAERGADTPDRIGPPRAVASGAISSRDMWVGVWIAFGVAILAGLYLIRLGGIPILVVGVASIIAALGYTNGPVPYGYRALGEVFVFAFFGLAATVGSRYVYDRTAPLDAWILAIPMGLLAAAILVANNVRDVETDRAVGKRTLAVVVGRRRAVWLYAGCLIGSFVVVAVAAAVGAVSRPAALSLLLAPAAVPLIRTLRTEREGPPLIGVLKGTARLQIGFSLLLAAGLLI